MPLTAVCQPLWRWQPPQLGSLWCGPVPTRGTRGTLTHSPRPWLPPLYRSFKMLWLLLSIKIFPCIRKWGSFKLKVVSLLSYTIDTANTWTRCLMNPRRLPVHMGGMGYGRSVYSRDLVSRLGWLSRGTYFDFTWFLISTHIMSDWGRGGSNSSNLFFFAFGYFSSASESAR